MDNLTDKIIKLKRSGYGKESIDVINSWEEDVQRLNALKELIMHPIIQEWLEEARSDIEGIDSILLNDRTKTDRERDYLFGRKNVLEGYIAKFTVNPQEELELIEKQVDDEINDSL